MERITGFQAHLKSSFILSPVLFNPILCLGLASLLIIQLVVAFFFMYANLLFQVFTRIFLRTNNHLLLGSVSFSYLHLCQIASQGFVWCHLDVIASSAFVLKLFIADYLILLGV